MKDRKMHLNNFFANVFCFFMVHQKKNIKRNNKIIFYFSKMINKKKQKQNFAIIFLLKFNSP
jgi:hypothetical protein